MRVQNTSCTQSILQGIDPFVFGLSQATCKQFADVRLKYWVGNRSQKSRHLANVSAKSRQLSCACVCVCVSGAKLQPSICMQSKQDENFNVSF